MKRFIEKILVIVALFGAMCTTLTLAPTDTYAAPNTACNHTFLGMRAWYHNLAYGSDCEIRIAESGKADGGKFATFASTILLNILVDISSMVGFGMIAMVMWGGYLYMFSSGEPGKIAKGKKTLISATVGLGICLLANILMSFIVTVITGA